MDTVARRHQQLGRRAGIDDIFGTGAAGGGGGTSDVKDPAGSTTTSENTGPTVGIIVHRPTDDDTTSTPDPTPDPNTKPAAQSTTTSETPPPPATTTSSTPVAPTTTTSAAPVVVPSTSSSSSVVLTTASVPRTVVSITPTFSTAPAATSSGVADSSGASSSNVGTIIGGIAGGVAGVVALVFAVTWFIRRKRASKYEDEFDANQFRRSAVLMDDPPTHDDVISRGFNPAPHHGASDGMSQYGGAPVTYGNMGRTDYDHSNGAGYNNGYGNNGPAWHENMSPHTAQPFLPNDHMATPGGYNPEPMHSPISATVAPYDSAYNQPAGYAADAGSAMAAAHAAAAYPSMGPTRRNSGGSQHANDPQTPGTQYANYPGVDANGSPRNSATDYLELSRSSVTPFQAAQYKIISNNIGAPVPQGLSTPIVEEHMNSMSSPFDDDHAMPSPPPPVATSPRIASNPPMLPEISRMSGMPGADRSAFEPVTPSPMAQESFAVHQSAAPENLNVQQTFPMTPSADHSTFSHEQQQSQNIPRPPPAAASAEQTQKKRPDTVYDETDAYGGF